ncbi:MAG TPA: hypothetical protein VH593_07360 [Ktedonobacteraceae bacterium]
MGDTQASPTTFVLLWPNTEIVRRACQLPACGFFVVLARVARSLTCNAKGTKA